MSYNKIHSIELNRVPISWDIENGVLRFFNIPTTMLWNDPSLLRLLQPLAEEIGYDLFRLMVAYSSSQGTDQDYHSMVTVLGSNFVDGFLAWGNAVSVAGWGRFELPYFDYESKIATVLIRNPWELSMQSSIKEEQKRWGCPFLQGKIIGIFSHALGINCWADEKILYLSESEEDLVVEFHIYQSKRTIQEELKAVKKQRLQELEKTLELEVERKTIELLRTEKQLQEKNRILTRLDQEKNEFLGIVAHDLKNPLSVIKGLSEEIEEYFDELSKEELIEFVSMIQNTTEKMFFLITNLLDVNAIESNQLIFKKELIDILPIIKELIREHTRRANIKNISLQFSYIEKPYIIFTDKNIFHQILDNLVSNAIKYSPLDATVWISLSEDNSFLRCIIRDEGEGIAQEEQSQLFTKFCRLSPKPTAGEHSTGLGLFIVKKFVNAMNGKVWCESEVGKGTLFLVEFPMNSTFLLLS